MIRAATVARKIVGKAKTAVRTSARLRATAAKTAVDSMIKNQAVGKTEDGDPDTDLLTVSREMAREILETDPGLERPSHAPLKQRALLRYPKAEALFRVG